MGCDGRGLGHRTTYRGPKVRLRDVLKPRKTNIGYLCDFGDSWEHCITITKIRSGLPGVPNPTTWAVDGAANPRIPAVLLAIITCSMPSLTPSTLTTPRSPNIWMAGIPRKIEELPLRIALGRLANRRNTARTRILPKNTLSQQSGGSPAAVRAERIPITNHGCQSAVVVWITGKLIGSLRHKLPALTP